MSWIKMHLRVLMIANTRDSIGVDEASSSNVVPLGRNTARSAEMTSNKRIMLFWIRIHLRVFVMVDTRDDVRVVEGNGSNVVQ